MTSDPERDAVIDALLPQVAFDGWTMKSVRQALVSLGKHPDDAPLLFPGGTGEMITAYCALADERMEQEAAATELSTLRVPARVKAVIALRLQQNRDNKEAIRRALAWLAIPTNAPIAAKTVAATVDAIWHAAGDTSADFSWYTKRGILAGVYSGTLLYWLRDPSFDDEETLAFLDRRLDNVGQITTIRKTIETRLTDLRDAVRGMQPPWGSARG
jgi:ubiquinone biosynthesis protein COQ9